MTDMPMGQDTEVITELAQKVAARVPDDQSHEEVLEAIQVVVEDHIAKADPDATMESLLARDAVVTEFPKGTPAEPEHPPFRWNLEGKRMHAADVYGAAIWARLMVKRGTSSGGLFQNRSEEEPISRTPAPKGAG